MLITGLHALRHTVCYTRIALHEGQFPTLPVFSILTPQVRSHSFATITHRESSWNREVRNSVNVRLRQQLQQSNQGAKNIATAQSNQ